MLTRMSRSICVFCGSNFGNSKRYAETANEVGGSLARRGLRLIYGGGNVGLMGVVADACLAAGGNVVGVIPQSLVDKEIAHKGLTELHVVRSMHERKAMMAGLSDAFVTLPGGLGTFEEFFEMATWTQLGLHRKACGVVNVAGYFDGLLALADRAVLDGFLAPEHRNMLLSHDRPDRLVDLVLAYTPPILDKWMKRTDC
jgi:uncharacterized protein (TIGR00730 family)